MPTFQKFALAIFRSIPVYYSLMPVLLIFLPSQKGQRYFFYHVASYPQFCCSNNKHEVLHELNQYYLSICDCDKRKYVQSYDSLLITNKISCLLCLNMSFYNIVLKIHLSLVITQKHHNIPQKFVILWWNLI